MATKYELPEEVNEKRLKTLGMEVEMKTFKTNVAQEEETCELDGMKQQSVIHSCSQECCAGDSNTDGRETKAMFTDDFLQTTGKSVSNALHVKKHVAPEEETSDNDRLMKIICVGEFTGGVGTKGVFIDDYLHVRPDPVKLYRNPVIGVKFYLKKIKWHRIESEKPFLIKLQIWEIGELERYSNMTHVFYKFCLGALVFWGTRNPSSLDGAIKWRQSIRKLLPSIPCILVTDNVAKEQWIGPRKIFESEVALDEFCKDHGFVDHFEIKSRDWESGEKSVFGQAVNCLLDEILKSE